MGAQPADAEHALACRIPGGPGRSGAVGPGGPSSSPRVGARCFLGRARPATIPAYSAGDAAGLADGRRTALRSRPSLRSGTGRPHNPPAPAPRTPAPVGFAAAVVESLGPPAESEQLVTRLPRIPACSAGDPNPLVHRHSGFPSALALGTSSRGGLSPLGLALPASRETLALFSGCPRKQSRSRQPSTAVTPCTLPAGPCSFAR